MDKENMQEIVQELKQKAQVYKSAIKFDIVEKSSFIIEVGALTVGTDDKGQMIGVNTMHPAQFSKKTVEEILLMNWRNWNGEKIKPIVYPRNEWYRNKLSEVEERIKAYHG